MYSALPCTAAAYLTLCNGRLTAKECLQQAIVNQLVPAEQLMAAAEQRRNDLGCSPLAVQAAIRLYRRPASFPPSLSAYARHLDQEIAESEDGAESARAFKEKRPPVWKLR
jgi:enoyl-CoA hydratase/carnithine racemase